ncbi:MAG: OmpA family protein [Bacteroidales bacterium]
MKHLFLFLFAVLLSCNFYAQQIDSIVVYFEINEFKLNPSEKQKLNKIKEYTSVEKITIEAYCDFLGSYDYNFNLSKNRAKTIEEYINSFNNKKEIISSVGKGYYPGTTEELRKNNNDRGIAEHRIGIIKIIYNNHVAKNKEITPGHEEDNNSNNLTIIVEESTIPIVRTGIEEKIIEALNDDSNSQLNIKLNNINFVGGTPNFLPESKDALVELLFVMKKYPELKIEIQGHICCQDPEAGDGWDMVNENYNLSLNRAKAVYDYLVINGISTDRLRYKGFAATKKLYPEETNEFQRSQNRRVEIQIFK